MKQITTDSAPAADISFLAFGFNPYLYFFRQQRPNWVEALQGKEGKLFSIIVLNNSTGVEASEIASFDYDKLLAIFKTPLELRKINYSKYPLFGFLFTKTSKDDIAELFHEKFIPLGTYVIDHYWLCTRTAKN